MFFNDFIILIKFLRIVVAYLSSCQRQALTTVVAVTHTFHCEKKGSLCFEQCRRQGKRSEGALAKSRGRALKFAYKTNFQILYGYNYAQF